MKTRDVSLSESIVRRPLYRLLLLLAFVAGASCTGAVETESHFQIGDRGEQVKAAREYLTQYGYLPNDELAAQNPTWRPAVLERSAQPDVFDEPLERAVLAYQRFHALDETGVLDDATVEQMAQPRCGVPETFAGGNEKFDLYDYRWGGSGQSCQLVAVAGNQFSLTYSIQKVSAGVWSSLAVPYTQEAFQSAIARALSYWSAQTSFKFTEVASGGCIRFKVPSALPAGTAGLTNSTYVTASNLLDYSDIKFSKSVAFAPGAFPTPAGKVDFAHVAMHEIGHALRLDHSSVLELGHPAVMHPSQWVTDDHLLMPDDRIAAHVSANVIDTNLGGEAQKATSVDVSKDGIIWVTTKTPLGHGYTIRAFSRAWTNIAGEATQVAVTPAGIPWVINDLGEVWRRAGTTGNAQDFANGWWERVGTAGTASKIAAGGNRVFILGKAVTRNTTEHNIYVYDGGWKPVTGFAADITVDSWARPWIIEESGALLVGHQVSLAFSTVSVNGGPNVWKHVRAGKDRSTIFAIDRNNVPYVLNEQNAIAGDDANDANARKRWLPWPYYFNAPTTLVSDGDSRVISISTTAPNGPTSVVGRAE